MSLCDTALAVLEEFGPNNSEAKLKSTLKELIDPCRIYFNFDSSQQVYTLIKPRSRESGPRVPELQQAKEEFQTTVELYAVNQVRSVVSELTRSLCRADIFDLSSSSAVSLSELK